MFGWIVGYVNKAVLESGGAGAGADGGEAKRGEGKGSEGGEGGGLGNTGESIGILDIYGFEIFEKNTFEQLCINYVNEKLQQLFIELTLKAEQDEYAEEGIQWTPIEYFNNQVVCDLIEKKNNSIFSLLTETCQLADSTDERFLGRLKQTLGSHDHFATSKFAGSTFIIKHYAGDVEYDATTMTEKNVDTLFQDLIDCMSNSSVPMLKDLFADKRSDDEKKHRPPAAVTQFKTSVNALMVSLKASNPHYVRCIKPNGEKRAGLFDRDLVVHQVRYLGLVENVRVRRAGFCFRTSFDSFVSRYKALSRFTWPNPQGWGRYGEGEAISAGDAAAQILEDGDAMFIKSRGGSADGALARGSGFQLGKSKVFIKEPAAVFALETARDKIVPILVTFIQRMVRRVQVRAWFLRKRACLCRVQATVKSRIAVKDLARTRDASAHLVAAWKGLKARRGLSEQDWMTCHVAQLTLRAQLHRYMGRKERRRKSLEAERGLPHGDYLELAGNPTVLKMLVKHKQEQVLFADTADKINNVNKQQTRTLLISDDFIYNLTEGKKPKENRRIPIQGLGKISMSTSLRGVAGVDGCGWVWMNVAVVTVVAGVKAVRVVRVGGRWRV